MNKTKINIFIIHIFLLVTISTKKNILKIENYGKD